MFLDCGGMTSKPGFRTERSVVARADTARIAGFLADPSTWPAWQSEILRTDGPDRIEVGAIVNGRASMLGFEVDGMNVTTGVDETIIEQDAVVGVGMTITYALQPEGEGVRITHLLTSDLPSGTLGRVLSFFLARRLKKMQRDLLENLVAQVEASSD